jgi:membrane-associated protease RseP (regulator of RpoE activity)
MALAGPMANLALAVIAFILIKVLLHMGIFQVPSHFDLFSSLVEPAGQVAARSPLRAISMLLSVMLSLNVMLALFNLMPVLPLDGASVLQGLFPNTLGRLYDSMRGTPMIELLGLMIAWNLFPHLSGPAFNLLLKLVYG